MDVKSGYEERAHIAALTSVIETLIAHVLTLETTEEDGDRLIARLRSSSRHIPRFVADDDQHASQVSEFEQQVEDVIAKITDNVLLRKQW